MEFKAEKINLDLDLMVLSGDHVNLTPKEPVNGKKALQLVKEWRKLENDPGEKIGLEVMDEELSMVYGTEIGWWLENFDPITIAQMLQHVARSLGGIKKN